MRLQLLGIDSVTGMQLHKGQRRFAPLFIRFGHHRASQHGGVAVQRIFHLDAADVFATRDDDVFVAVFDLHIALGIHHAQVARMEPTAFKGLRSGVGVFQIALHDDVAAKHDFAHGLPIVGCGGHALRVFQGHALLQGIANALSTVEQSLLVQAFVSPLVMLDAHRGGAIDLGQAIHMGDVKAQLGHTLQHGGWRTRTRYHAFDLVCDSRLQVRGGLDQQVVNHGGSAIMVDAVLCHGLQYQSCIDFAQTHMHTPQHGDGPWEAPAIAVKHRQGPEVARKVGHVPRHRIADRVQVSATVVGDYALGVTGGA